MGYKRRSNTRLARTGRVAAGLAGLARRAFRGRSTRSKGRKRTGGVKSILARKHTQQRIAQMTGGSISRFVHKVPSNKFNRRLFKDTSSNFYCTNGSFRLVTGGGAQNATSFGLLTGGAVGAATDLPYVFGRINGVATTGYKTTRAFFESVSAKYMMTNQQLTNCYVTLYDIVCRRDTNETPDNAWLNGTLEEGIYTNSVIGCTPFAARVS